MFNLFPRMCKIGDAFLVGKCAAGARVVSCRDEGEWDIDGILVDMRVVVPKLLSSIRMGSRRVSIVCSVALQGEAVGLLRWSGFEVGRWR